MFDYILDFSLVAVFVIGITAIMGVVTNGIGEKVFGGGNGDPESFNHSAKTQQGWNNVGGKNRK